MSRMHPGQLSAAILETPSWLRRTASFFMAGDAIDASHPGRTGTANAASSPQQNQSESSERSEWTYTLVATRKDSLGARGHEWWFKHDSASEWQSTGSDKGLLALLASEGSVTAHGASSFLSRLTLAARKPRNWLIAGLALGAAILAAGVISGKVNVWSDESALVLANPPSAPAKTSVIEEGLAKSVVGIRAGLPKKIDDMTTLVWVSYSGTRMVYENRIEVDGRNVDQMLKDKLRKLIIAKICTSATSLKLLNVGVQYRFVYADVNARPVTTVDITKADCV